MRLFGRRGRLRSGRLFEVGAGLLVDDAHRQLDLAAVVVAQDLDLDPIAFPNDVGRLVDPRLGELRNVDEAILRTEEIDEGAELDSFHHRSVVNLADLRLRGDRLDPVDGRLDLRAVARRDLHRAVVLDVDLGPGLFHDLPDDLAARADHLANLVGRDLHRLDARRKLAELGSGPGDRLAHLAQDMHAAVTRLGQRLAHDLLGDAGDLDVHLQRSDAFAGAGDLEIHVAEMVLVAENVAEHGEPRALENEAHRDAGDRALERHPRVHQRQRRAADRGHRRRAVRLGDLRDDADRVGEFGRGRQHRTDRPPGELAVADFAPAGRAHAAGFADRIWGEVIVEQEPLLVGAVEGIDILLVLAGAQRRDHERLGFAAGEQSRAVGAGQHADLGLDRAHGGQIAAVDASLIIENVPAHDLGLGVVERFGDLVGREFGLRAVRRQRRHDLRLNGVDGGVALLLLRQRISGAQIGLADLHDRLFDRRSIVRGELPRLLGGLFSEPDDRLDYWLECGVAGHHRFQHDVLAELLGFRLDHQHRVRGAGDDQIERRVLHLLDRCVHPDFAFDDPDPRRPDR